MSDEIDQAHLRHRNEGVLRMEKLDMRRMAISIGSAVLSIVRLSGVILRKEIVRFSGSLGEAIRSGRANFRVRTDSQTTIGMRTPTGDAAIDLGLPQQSGEVQPMIFNAGTSTFTVKRRSR
jgi:hypothetical protein